LAIANKYMPLCQLLPHGQCCNAAQTPFTCAFKPADADPTCLAALIVSLATLETEENEEHF